MRIATASLRLVAITDSLRDGIDGLAARAASAVRGGATMLQLRLKDESPRTLVEVARRLRAACPEVPLVVNGRADVALAAAAHGVHLELDDPPPGAIRRIVPAGFLIGASVRDAAHLAELVDVDYVAVGPVFARAGTPVAALGVAGVRALVERAAVPVLAVGGLDVGNAAAVVMAGAAGIGVISAVFGEDDPSLHARGFRSVLDASGR